MYMILTNYIINMVNTSVVRVGVGESDSTGYIRVNVTYGSEINVDDLEFISEDTSVANISFHKQAGSNLYSYEVKGISPGETYIYVKYKYGNLTSFKRKVVVK